MSNHKRVAINKNAKTVTPSTIRKAIKLGVEVNYPSLSPTAVSHLTDKWIHYGEDNSQPAFLNSLVNKSPLHANLIRLRQNLVAGDGLNLPEALLDGKDVVNDLGETVEDLLDKSTGDISIQEVVAYQVVYNKKKTDIVNIFWLDSTFVRASRDTDDYMRPVGYYVCVDWSNYQENDVKYYPRFDPYNITSGSQIYYGMVKAKSGQPYIPEVSYLPAILHIELAEKMSKFSYNFIDQGMFAGGVLNVKGNMEENVQREFISDLKDSHSGEQNVGKLMLLLGEQNSEVSLTSFNTQDMTPLINNIQETCTSNICMAHGAQGIVAAVAPAGSSLGSDGKMLRDSYEAFDKSVIKHLRKPISQFWNQVYKFKGIENFKLEFKASDLLAQELPEYLVEFMKPQALAARAGVDVDELRPEYLDAAEAPETDENVAISDGQDQESETNQAEQILSRIERYRKD